MIYVLAFLGGLILNVMPCVLPVIGLKMMALVDHTGSAAKNAITYTVGIVTSFVGLAGIMLALRAMGHAVGWGWFMQSPVFLGVLAAFFVIMGLGMLDMWMMPSFSLATVQKSPFFSGLMAASVAAPCTGPLLGATLGATLTMPIPQALSIFLIMGLGMASPYLVLGLWPGARRWIPKPGQWMVTFKRAMGGLMIASGLIFGWMASPIELKAPTKEYVIYDRAKLEELRAAGTPVFVEFTAKWCLICQTNKPALKSVEWEKYGIIYMLADWTNDDPEITRALEEQGRAGVPLYLFYPPDEQDVRVLPQMLSYDIIIEKLQLICIKPGVCVPS